MSLTVDDAEKIISATRDLLQSRPRQDVHALLREAGLNEEQCEIALDAAEQPERGQLNVGNFVLLLVTSTAVLGSMAAAYIALPPGRYPAVLLVVPGIVGGTLVAALAVGGVHVVKLALRFSKIRRR